MSKQNWNLKTSEEEMVLHLQEEHCYPFNDRRSLSVQDFIFEHFPEMVKHLCDKDYGYLNKDGRKSLVGVRKKLQKVLWMCERKGVPIAKVYDFNEKNEAEWRICKPSQEQVSYLKFKRWFPSAEGFFNKALLQSMMIGEEDIDLLIEELKSTIREKQEIRLEQKKKKKKKKEIEIENQMS